MADPALPTSVDVDDLASALAWLRDTRDFIDRHILAELRQIPGAVNHQAMDADGEITDVAATHFGLSPSGLQVAGKHAGVYNAVLHSLTSISADLQTAIDGTSHLASRHRRIEQVDPADIGRLTRSSGQESN